MASLDKRMEAIAELYESERHYLRDLGLWIDMIKGSILGASSLALNRKYAYFASILSHSTAIYDLHVKILCRLREKNASVLKQNRIQDTGIHNRHEDGLQDLDMELLRQASTGKGGLEYYSVYATMLDSFLCYVKYFEDLPKVEYYFKKLMFTDKYFGDIVKDYMTNNNMTDLGINHFIYRPSTKISRYPIFFKAIAKRESDPLKKKEYEDVQRGFDRLIKHLEGIFTDRKAQFETFVLSYRLVFGDEVRNKFSLGLVYKKNKLMLTKKIIVKKDKLKPASYKDVYLFNRMILICLTTENEFDNVIIDDDPIFLSKLYLVKSGVDDFAPNENLEMLYPLFLVQKENKSIKALYFSDDTNREVFYKSVQSAIKSVRGCMDRDIRIEVLRHEEDLNCVCKPESGRNAFISSYGMSRHRSMESSGRSGYTEYNMDDQKSGKHSSDNASKERSSDAKLSGMNSGHNEGESRQHESESSGSVVFGTDSICDSTISSGNQESDKNRERSMDSEYEDRSDSLPLQGISGCAYSSQVEFDRSSSLDGDASSQIEYNFDRFGDEDDVPSDVSSASSKTYLDIFPEDTNRTSDINTSSESSVEMRSRESGGFCGEIFKHTTISLSQMSIKHSYQYGRVTRNRSMIIYSNKNGIFRVLHREQVKEEQSEDAADLKIHGNPAQRIFYDPDLELLMFQSGEYAYVSGFHADSASLEPQEINTTIRSIFYGKLNETAYIALVTNEEYSFSIIHLLKVEYDHGSSLLEIKVVRKLYVGFTIFNIFFLKGRIIISCKDFELIEIDTLRTQELLEAYDASISLLLGSKDHFEARSIFKLDVNTFLLCFNGGGYLIDRTGSYKYNNVSFSWEILGEEFKIFKKWIIVVGKSYITIFEIETGKMVFMEYMPGMKVVGGTKMPLLYSRKGIYLIDFGNTFRDEYKRHGIYDLGRVEKGKETSHTMSACSSNLVEAMSSGCVVSGVYGHKPVLEEDESINAAIDSFFFHSFSSQSLISTSSRWSSIAMEHSCPDDSDKKVPRPCSDAISSKCCSTPKTGMKRSWSRHKEYVPRSAESSRSLPPDRASGFRRSESQGPRLSSQGGAPRSFKMRPRGDYKVTIAPPHFQHDLVPKARERKMKVLRKYSKKKRKAWRERNLTDGKIDEMDIIDKYCGSD